MSINGIITRFFNTTVSIQRRATSLTSTGSLSETWANIATNVNATIQPLSVSELNILSQGKEYNASHKAYLPDDVVTIKNGDRLVDSETGKTHNIIGVQLHQAARSDVSAGHHYKLYLEIPKTDKS